MVGRTIALVGDTGSGKTTQIGELAKARFKETRQKTVLNSIDRGGYESIKHLIKLGVIDLRKFDGETESPWSWANAAVSPESYTDEVGIVAIDSGTSLAEVLLQSCAQMGAENQDIGGRPTPKLIINKGKADAFRIGTNVDTHYGVVQQVTLEMMRKASYLIKKGVDVVWTFSLYRGEGLTDNAILGPKLVGKALTASLPKEFQYTFRLASIPEVDRPPRHVLYLETHQELNGMVGYSNSRYPIDAATALPLMIEPASVSEAIRLIEEGEKEAEERAREELGL